MTSVMEQSGCFLVSLPLVGTEEEWFNIRVRVCISDHSMSNETSSALDYHYVCYLHSSNALVCECAVMWAQGPPGCGDPVVVCACYCREPSPLEQMWWP